MRGVRERLGLLCDQLTRYPEMDKEIRGAGAGTQLDELLSEVRSQSIPDAQRLAALMDAIEDACARGGLAGVTTVSKGYPPLPRGFHQDESPPPVWVCPTGCCLRAVFYDEVASTPMCVAGGVPMIEAPVAE